MNYAMIMMIISFTVKLTTKEIKNTEFLSTIQLKNDDFFSYAPMLKFNLFLLSVCFHDT
jgi:hypothetical protein